MNKYFFMLSYFMITTFSITYSQKKEILFTGNKEIYKNLVTVLQKNTEYKYNLKYIESDMSLLDNYESLKCHIDNSKIVGQSLQKENKYDFIVLEEGLYAFMANNSDKIISSIRMYENLLKKDGRIIFQGIRQTDENFPATFCVNDTRSTTFKNICSDTLYSQDEVVKVLIDKEKAIATNLKKCKITPLRDFLNYTQIKYPAEKFQYKLGLLTNDGNLAAGIICAKTLTGKPIHKLMSNIKFNYIKDENILKSFYNE